MTGRPSVRSRLRAGAWFAGLAAGVLDLAAADPVAAARAAPVFELPKFEVSDSRVLPPPESWRYAELPGFEILSNLSERATKRFVDDFLLLQQVIEIIMPGLTHGTVPVPTALILCGRGNSFDAFVPTDQREERFGRNTLFFRNAERSAIVVDFALAELQFGSGESEESDPYRAFYRSYFRFLLRRKVNGEMPAWFEEGLVQIFAATEFNRKWVTFAQIGDGFGGEKTGDFNRRLQQRALIPFQKFLEPEAEGSRDEVWAAQCYAWVHLCLYGENQKYQRGFLRYLTRLGRGEGATETLFKECFGKTYQEMGLILRGYVGFTVYKAMQYKAKKDQELPPSPPVDLAAAGDAVVGRLKGEVLQLAGHGEAAHLALIAPYIRGERDPRLLAALGLDERAGGRDDRARKFLEAAAAAKVSRARAYLELGRLRLIEAKARPGATGGRLDAAQVQSVLEALFDARAQPPPLAEAYRLIAETWSASAVPATPDNFSVLVEGVRLFPRDGDLVFAAALLAVQRGFAAEARELVKLGERTAEPGAGRDRFTVLGAALGRDGVPAPAVPAAPAREPVRSPFDR